MRWIEPVVHRTLTAALAVVVLTCMSCVDEPDSEWPALAPLTTVTSTVASSTTSEVESTRTRLPGSECARGTSMGRTHLMCMTANGAPEYGLVVVLHGRGSTAAEMKTMTRLDELAAPYDLAVVYPNAGGGRWGDDTFVTADRPTGDEDLTYLDQLIDTLRADVRVGDGPVAIVGFSNGASMALRYTAQRPGEVYAVVSVAGQLASDPAVRPSERTPLLQIYGTGDPLRSFGDGVAAPAVRSADGPTPTLSTPATVDAFLSKASGPLHHTVEESDEDATDSTTLRTERWTDDEGTVVVQHSVVGGGHRWPSALVDPYIDDTFGATSRDVDASAEAIEFVVAAGSAP